MKYKVSSVLRQVCICGLFVVKVAFSSADSSLITRHQDENTRKLINEIQIALNTLDARHPFVYYQFQLSKEEENALKNLKINFIREYNNYGNLQTLEGEVKEFIKALGKENTKYAQEISQLIGKFVRIILKASGKATAWVAVRSCIPISKYNLPRWHKDGYYFTPFTGNPYKFVITLKGSSTLFYRLPFTKRKKFDDLLNAGTAQNNYNRQALADELGDSNQAISKPHSHQGAVFIVGSSHAAVHSEPPVNEERLFLSVLPGTREQIKQWENQ